MAKKIFILGTQSLTSSEDSTLRFGNDNIIVVPFPECIDELEKMAAEFTEKGRIARKLLDYLSTFQIEKLLSEEGVRQKNGSILRYEKGFTNTKIPECMGRISSFDKRRIQVAVGLKEKHKDISVIIITKRPGFRQKLRAAKISAQNFRDDTFPALEEQYTGRVECQTTKEKIDLLYSQGHIFPKDIIKHNEIEWCTNLFLNIKSITGDSSALARYDGKSIVKLEFQDCHPYGISALKAGQHMALEALLQNPKVAPIVIIKGGAGTGKTYVSLAAALEKTLPSSVGDKIYTKIMLTTPTETLREENLGFLPGELEEKFDPYLGGVMDNLSLLLDSASKNKSEKKDGVAKKQSKKETGKSFIDRGVVVLQLIGHLRGRSITDTIFIIDESQNIEPSVIKSIVTRAGQNSKFVFLGDPTQIDNPDLNERYNGLVYLSEKFKGNPLCWQVTLDDEESVRSELAFIAAKIL